MGNPAKEMAEQVLAGSGLTAAKLGLRFDRVVVRVLGDLEAFADSAVPEGSAIVVTISAPIRLPAKTVDAMRDRITELPLTGAFAAQIHGNAVRARLVGHASGQRPKLVGFVHNPDSDPGQLLDHAEHWLRQ